MSLLTIAEVLSGETLVSPGGPVDRVTAQSAEVVLWEAVGESLAEDRERAEEPAADEVFALV
jgi:hypothetical protein